MLASSFIFGGKGFIRLQKTNIKDEYLHIFFWISKSAVCRPLLDWQLLTPETTFGLLVDKVGGMTFWKQISQAFLTLSFSLFSTFRFFSHSFPSRHTPLSERLEQAMFPRRKANDHVSVTFLSSHFRPSLFPLRLRWRIFSFFLNPCPRSHDQCFRNFAFATYQGE